VRAPRRFGSRTDRFAARLLRLGECGQRGNAALFGRLHQENGGNQAAGTVGSLAQLCGQLAFPKV
jgi:hypothetical protein